MKYLKTLIILAVAAGGLTAVLGASSASASVLCTEKVSPCPAAKRYDPKTHGKLTFSIIKGHSAAFETTKGETLDTCTGSTLSSTTQSQGEGAPVVEKIEELTWEGCTFSTKTISNGELTIEEIGETTNGTVNIKGTEITINTVLFGSCVYGSTSAIDIGTLEGGTEADIEINGILPKKSGGAGCPAELRWKDEKVHTDNMGHPLWLVNS